MKKIQFSIRQIQLSVQSWQFIFPAVYSSRKLDFQFVFFTVLLYLNIVHMSRLSNGGHHNSVVPSSKITASWNTLWLKVRILKASHDTTSNSFDSDDNFISLYGITRTLFYFKNNNTYLLWLLLFSKTKTMPFIIYAFY